MLILISPSKTLDYSSPPTFTSNTYPELIKFSRQLVSVLKRKSPRELALLMNISPKLAELNALRFNDWQFPFPEGKARPALSAFKGDVYEGLKAWELDRKGIEFADRHLRILSGLYGLLKPSDLMLAYRLEMGTPIQIKDHRNLYHFWGNKITRSVIQSVKASGSRVLVNLASDEYAKAVDFESIRTKIITPVFNEFRNGQFKFISYNGKRARGLMTRFIIDNRITDPSQLKLFNYEGYEYLENRSVGNQWVFVR